MNPGRARRTALVAVPALALIAVGCGTAADDRGIEAEAVAAQSTAVADHPELRPPEPVPDTASPDTSAVEPPAVPDEDQAIVPPPDVAENVLTAARDAAPDSELSLRDCTDWVADPDKVLESEQAEACAAMLSAAVATCAELECFTPPKTTAPTATAAAEPDEPEPEATTPPDDQPEPEATTPPEDQPEPEATTPPDEPEPEATTPPEDQPEPEAIDAPEGGHPPLAVAGMVPRDEPYWGYPTCGPQPPWPSDCYPPSEWETPQDLTNCLVSPYPEAGVGGICASRRPDEPPHSETPRQTRDVVLWMDRCDAVWHPVSCGYLLFTMRWALDYLGAHPWCVLGQYNDRLAQYDELWSRGYSVPNNIYNGHGWHRCPSVIDPPWPDDPGRRLSETGISLAEQCRVVLPDDIELETTTGRRGVEPERFGSDCDAWAAWVENRPAARHWRECDRTARLAQEWMEHHYGTPERYFPVNC